MALVRNVLYVYHPFGYKLLDIFTKREKHVLQSYTYDKKII
jgi:hypothetical protein